MAESKGKTAGAAPAAPATPPAPKPKPKTRKDGKTRTIPMSWMAITATTIGSGVWLAGIWFNYPNQSKIVQTYGDGDQNVPVVPFPTEIVEYLDAERSLVQKVEGALPDLKVYPGNDERNPGLWGEYEQAHPPFAIYLDPAKKWPKRLTFKEHKEG